MEIKLVLSDKKERSQFLVVFVTVINVDLGGIKEKTVYRNI